jgi:hypothetical protein
MKHVLMLKLVSLIAATFWVSQLAYAQATANHPPLVVGPVALNCIDKPCSAATVTANALGSGVNGPLTAQTGMTINIQKDNWWTGGDVGEVDGLDVFVRQNAPHSDSSGILINVQNQGHGFLSATEFASTIVDPVKNVITRGIDVQEGVLDAENGDYIGAVYNADTGALGTGVLIQNTTPTASWNYAIQYLKNGQGIFSVDGDGNVTATSLNLTGGSLKVDNLEVNGQGVMTAKNMHVNLATPASSSAPCTPGQIGADTKYVYVCVAKNQWKRSALSAW